MKVKSIDSLYVEIFDWPSRFLVESDDDNRTFGHSPQPNAGPITEGDNEEELELVDLDEGEEGGCGCADFQFNVACLLGNPEPHRTTCKHILAARSYLHRLNYTKPKILKPLTIDE